MIQALNQPLVVVPLDEGTDDCTSLVERGESMEPHALLFQRAHEALDDAVAFWFADKRRAVRDPEPCELGPKRVGHILRAPVTADGQAARDVLAKHTECRPHTLMNRFERRPAVTELGHVPADDVVAGVVDRSEEPAPALTLGVEPRRIRAPHHVRPLGRDRASMSGIAMRMASALRRQQPMCPHQPEDTVFAHPPAERP